jgi:tRNA A37 threonylcarbamoyladenosine modification protein TsaB
MNLESPKVTVAKSAEYIFTELTQVKNFEKLMPENIAKFEVIDENCFAEYRASQLIYFFGDGAEKCKPVFTNDPHSFFIDSLYPSASASIAAAHTKFEQNIFEDVAYFEPFYLKEFLFNK